ncbi:MAG: hypothetical protein ACTSSP_08750 [Candidatus Asgardarchaeia archaeon]
MNKISSIITEVCRNLGIHYKSKFLEESRNNSVDRLSKIYLQLKEIIGELSEIEENNRDINGVVCIFENAIKQLEEIDHEIIQEAILISQKQKGVN